MPDILLCSINAKYIHASLGARYLLANLGELQTRAALLEFEINQRALDIVESILNTAPKIVGIGVYIWNAVPALSVVRLLKKVSPDTIVVLGGPEVSFESDQQEICELADYVISGEADIAFAELCRSLLGSSPLPTTKFIKAQLPELTQVQFPYDLYSSRDLVHRILYLEVSRGCPFTCEFCLSSLEIPVRQFELPRMFAEIERLIARGAKTFKFVDRTFNLNLRVSRSILEFFLQRYVPGMFFHFEMIPDRFPEALRELVAKFPAGALQFEVGIQSFNPQVNQLISRRQDFSKIEETLTFLRQKTGVHVHADLIVGLPGESVESFAQGFDRLVKLAPQEIQVGMLKRLRGTPIVRHDQEWQMVFSSEPPYEILSNRVIDFQQMRKLSRFSRFWDLYSNSGNFNLSLPLLWAQQASSFYAFMEFSCWVYQLLGKRHEIAFHTLSAALCRYLIEYCSLDRQVVLDSISSDYRRCDRGDLPPVVAEVFGMRTKAAAQAVANMRQPELAARQKRHLGPQAEIPET